MQASYGPLMAADCMVLGGDVKNAVCGGVTDFLVQPHDALSRTIPHQQALSATVTGDQFTVWNVELAVLMCVGEYIYIYISTQHFERV